MKRPEDNLQAACFDWLRLARPDVLAWANRNEGKRTFAEMTIARKTGFLPGVADITIAIPRPERASPLLGMIELKSDKGTLSDNQQLFRDKCKQKGIPYAVCRSLTEFQGTISGWCGPSSWIAEDVPTCGSHTDTPGRNRMDTPTKGRRVGTS
jgi:hypothetical protein